MKVKARTAPNGREHQGGKLVALRAMGMLRPNSTAKPLSAPDHRSCTQFQRRRFRSCASLGCGLIFLELSSLTDKNRAGKSPVPNLVASRSIGDSFRKETWIMESLPRGEPPVGRGIRPRRENDAPSTGK